MLNKKKPKPTMWDRRKAAIKDLVKLRAICRRLYDVDIYSKNRNRSDARPRQLVMYAMWSKGHSISCVADVIDRDRATVIYSVGKVIHRGWTEEGKRLRAFLNDEKATAISEVIA